MNLAVLQSHAAQGADADTNGFDRIRRGGEKQRYTGNSHRAGKQRNFTVVITLKEPPADQGSDNAQRGARQHIPGEMHPQINPGGHHRQNGQHCQHSDPPRCV